MTVNRDALVTSLKMAIAGLIAMAVMVFYHLDMGYWAVVTVAAITVQGEYATFIKSLMRLIGTLLGAIVGYLLSLLEFTHPFSAMFLLFLFLIMSSAIALQKNTFNYAGLIASVTMIIVMALSTDKHLMIDAAFYRTLAVMLGIVITVIVNCVVGYRNMIETGFYLPKWTDQPWEKEPWWSCIRIALTAVLTFAAWFYLRFPQGFWLTLSCLFIMEESNKATEQKGWLRFVAHVIAAGFGLLAALIAGQNVWLLAFCLGLGFATCGYLVGMQKSFSSLGNTCGIALAIMLLAGYGHQDVLYSVSVRFLNVCAGIAIGIFMTQPFWKSGKVH